MDELGFVPNAMAQALASKRSRIIALLFPEGERGLNLTELEFILGAAARAGENGYHLLLWTGEGSTVDEVKTLKGRGLVDGVLVMEVLMQDDRVQALVEAEVPFALIGRTADPDGLDFADTDFEQTTRLAIDHLAELGHRDIAFLNQSKANFSLGYAPAVRAETGMLAAAKDRGVRVTVHRCASTTDAGRRAFETISRRTPQATAVVAINEQAVVGLVDAATSYGWSVPDQLSVVSIVSSARTAEMTLPPLTTVSPPAREVGRIGVDVLIRRLEGDPTAAAHELVPSVLVERGSSGPVGKRVTRPR
jgi:DNA-binding LacI/PurR family transcriptional regulator